MPTGTPSDSIDNHLASSGDSRIICGFWRRVIAFIIDCTILGSLGDISGWFLFDFYAHLGGWGRLLGFSIALTYFGLLNSFLGKGKTLGKRIMKIEVVNRSGNSIPMAHAFLRTSVLCAPWFFNGAPIPTSIVVSPAGYGIGLLLFGLGGAIIYLYIFNRRTRQSLHDLVVGTFVVRSQPKGIMPNVFMWKTHLVVIGVWLVAVIGYSVIDIHRARVDHLVEIRKNIESSGKFIVGWITQDREMHRFFLTVTFKENPDDYEAAAKNIAAMIFDKDPDVLKKGGIDLIVCYGYDIGISMERRCQNFDYSLGKWNKQRIHRDKFLF